VSAGRARCVGLGDHNEPEFPEAGIAVRVGAPVGMVSGGGPGRPLPPIEEDLDDPGLTAGGDQRPKQLRPIPRHDDESVRHFPTPTQRSIPRAHRAALTVAADPRWDVVGRPAGNRPRVGRTGRDVKCKSDCGADAITAETVPAASSAEEP